MNVQFTEGITALLGPNGAGKTTILRTLTTLLKPRLGTITIEGIPLNDRKSIARARENIGFLPQDFHAPSNFTVRELVAYSAWLRHKGNVEEAIGYVDLLDKAYEKMKNLSGGMKQRAAIAATIVGKPKILVFDEPTAGLDPAQCTVFRNLISGLRNHVVILSTHLVEDVHSLADRVIILAKDGILFEGTPELLAAGYEADKERSALERGYLAALHHE